jgi:hypothetical protein
MTIWFDMDGTIANLYAVENWLADLRAENVRPYTEAAPMLDFSKLAKILCYLQLRGWKLGIISWTSKGGSEPYNLAVEVAKRAWLARYLPSVEWDEIKIVRYGTNKHDACGGGILFDDEEGNRRAWGNNAYTPEEIIKVLKMLAGG